MTIDSLRRLLAFVLFFLAQALVLNRIQLFHCATPLLYVYFVVMFPRAYPRWAALLWSFALGLTVDMFSNTPGVAAASMTLIGFLQPYLIELCHAMPRRTSNPRPRRLDGGALPAWQPSSWLSIVWCTSRWRLSRWLAGSIGCSA